MKISGEAWRKAWELLANERGELGDKEEPFTDEELIALGEKEPEEKPEESEAEPAEKPEGEAPEKVENMVPQSRVDQITSEKLANEQKAREYEEKLNLLKSNPSAYFAKYRDELPDDQRPPQEVKESDLLIQGGPFDGMTLGQLAEENPFEAMKLYQGHLAQQEQEKQTAVQRELERKASVEKEVNSFIDMVRKEHFGGAETLTEEQNAQLGETYRKTLDWMQQTNRINMNVSDAYTLMTMNDRIARAKGQAASGVLDKITDATVPSVPLGGSDGVDSGFDGYMAMKPEQLATAIDKMSETDAARFYREAPKQLKDKHPALPWG